MLKHWVILKIQSPGLDAKKDGKGMYGLVPLIVCVGIHLGERPSEVHGVSEVSPTYFWTHE